MSNLQIGFLIGIALSHLSGLAIGGSTELAEVLWLANRGWRKIVEGAGL